MVKIGLVKKILGQKIGLKIENFSEIFLRIIQFFQNYPKIFQKYCFSQIIIYFWNHMT